MDTNFFLSIRPRLAAAVGIGAVSAALFVSGCGQDFQQDGGAIPVPETSTEGLRVQTPGPNPEAPPLIEPGYAPPHTAGPTQTAVPNLPGGKY